MDSIKLNEAITQYYKLKETYDDKLNKNKLKIINNPVLTLKEKEQKFKQIKKLCINCAKPGGTIFSNNNGILKVICGNISNPCNLNIEIQKGKYMLSDNLLINLENKINNIKIEIIKIKLDYLFNYITQEDALVKFNLLKDELDKENILYNKVKIFNINITDNPTAKTLLDSTKDKLFEEIQIIKDYCKLYKSTNNQLLLTDVVEKYISIILPINKTISDIEYIYKNIEKKGDESFLIEKKYTLESLEYTLEEGKIIKNKK